MPAEPPPSDIPEALRRLKKALNSGQLVPPATQISNVPDAGFNAEKKDLDVQHLKAQLAGLNQDIKQRKTYASCTFWLVVAWLLAIVAVVFFQGFKVYGFSLDSNVIMVLIGSTTTGVLGLFLYFQSVRTDPLRRRYRM